MNTEQRTPVTSAYTLVTLVDAAGRRVQRRLVRNADQAVLKRYHADFSDMDALTLAWYAAQADLR